MRRISANIENFVRQEVRVPKSKPLLPIFEAVSNSLDSIAERPGNGLIRITVHRDTDIIDGERGHPHTFAITDNGVGFNQENTAAFDELYSDHKVRSGGKGRGRFAFLKVFRDVQIDSNFYEGSTLKNRSFHFNFNYSVDKTPKKIARSYIQTVVSLSGMREEFAKEVPRDQNILARELIAHFLPVILSDRDIEIVLDDGEEIYLKDFFSRNSLIGATRTPFVIGQRSFSLLSVKLRPKSGFRHRLILAASAREVRADALEKFVPVLAAGPLELEGEPDGFIFVAIVEGDFLDEKVDPMRVAFTDEEEPEDEVISDEILVPRGDLFGEPRSIRQIKGEALKIIRQQLDSFVVAAVHHRSEAITDYIHRDGMGYHFLKSEIPELAKNLRATDDQAIEASLHAAAYTERRKRSAQAWQLLSATPKEKSEDAYFEKWSQIVDSLGDVAKSDLANYVAHRRVIIDLVADVIRTTENGSYRREEVIHSIVFPKGEQSGSVSYEQQNLWLIDERLTFHEHLFSDISIGRITAGEGEIDSLQRPDLAIFESGFASFHDGARPPAQLVVVELKQPARDNASRDDPVGKTLQYVKKLKDGRAKTEGGAVIDIEENALTTVYILADWTADFRRYLEREDFKEMPGDVGRYRYRERENIMFIAMSFERLIENARRRNRIFFKKLGIEQ